VPASQIAPNIRKKTRGPVISFLFPLILFVTATLAYINTVTYDYAWDDKLVITANTYTTKGLRGLPDIFTKRVSVAYKSEYRPVPQALYAIEYDLFRASPHAAHTFNVAWYALNCLMVYVFLRFTFLGLDKVFVFLTALLFVVHPLHVEVVANIKSRDEILALFFGLSSVILLVKALEQRRWKPLVLGIVCFAAAFLSKTNAVTLLPMVLVVAWYRSSEWKLSRGAWVSIGAVGLCTLGLVLLARHLQTTVSNDSGVQLNSTVLNNIFLWTTHPKTIVPTALVIIGRYAALFLYPHPLIHLYGYNQIPLSSWKDAVTWLVIGALAALVIYVKKTWHTKSPIIFGVVFFAFSYSVYSNLFFYAPDTMADRYMFGPSVGLAVIVTFCVFKLASIRPDAPELKSARARVVMALFVAVIAAYFATTVIGNRDWRNDSTLIHNRIRYMQSNAAALAIYGSTLTQESYELKSPAMQQRQQAAAMNALLQAIRIYPDFQAAWIAIGKLFAEHGIYDKAELSFIKAQRLEPLSPDSYFCLGTLYLAQQDRELAIPYLEKAVLLDPKMEEAYVMLGKAYLQAGNISNLGALTMTARAWFPDDVDLKALQASYYFRMNDYARAFELANAVLSKDPRNLLAMTVLASPAVQASSKKYARTK
jgi:protein O-mannosyl-transferase